MSATLLGDGTVADGATVVKSSGRAYPVEVSYPPRGAPRLAALLSRRGALEENERIRAKFGIDDASQSVLHEYRCALMHADGSSKGKLYVTRNFLCFSGSLFGRDT